MNKIAAIILLSCFSAILTVQTLAYEIISCDEVELLERDCENESEEINGKELTDDFYNETIQSIADPAMTLISWGSSVINHNEEFFEITLPPPESDTF